MIYSICSSRFDYIMQHDSTLMKKIEADDQTTLLQMG